MSYSMAVINVNLMKYVLGIYCDGLTLTSLENGDLRIIYYYINRQNTYVHNSRNDKVNSLIHYFVSELLSCLTIV